MRILATFAGAFAVGIFMAQYILPYDWLLFCAAAMIYGMVSNGFAWQFYPVMQGRPVDAAVVILYLIYAALGMTPVFLHWQEARVWKKLQKEAEA